MIDGEGLDKVTRERLAQANGRLKAGNVGVLLRHRGWKLYLRAILPPKPGSKKDKPHQQEIASGFRANPAGISAAEKEARRVGALLESKAFSWLPYLKTYYPNCQEILLTQISTLELWDKYVIYKTPTVAETTIRTTYTKTRKKVVKFGRSISDRLTAIEFRDFLLQDGCEPVTARKYLVQLKEGCQLNHANFLRRAWHGYRNRHEKFMPGIVKRLAEEGKIDHYREPYACRDTFISHCIEKKGLGYKQVADWVGNSSAVVHKHYAGTVEKVEVPDLGF